MAYSKLVSFDRPLANASLPGSAGRFCTAAELSALDEAGYRRGIDATRALADQQMVEFRADVERLGHGVFEKLTDIGTKLECFSLKIAVIVTIILSASFLLF